MIDIHCHLIPGIDDGPPDLSTALALARSLVDDGVTAVVMTPHVFPGRFENRRSSISDDQTAFVQTLREQCPELQVMWAGEVRLTAEALDLLAMDELPFLGLSGGYRNMLLEMPDGQVPLGALNFVRYLMSARIRPVIAHPERNRGVMDQIDRLEPLLAAGSLVQVTAGSVIGQFGARAQEVAIELIDRGWVHALASDAHNLSGRRPRMREAAQWLSQHRSVDIAHRLTVSGPGELCAQNTEVNAPQGLPQKPIDGVGRLAASGQA